jgi:hypothetical protein
VRSGAVIRALVSIALTWAMAGIPALPPVHAHRAGIEGRRAAVVHAHPQVAARRGHDAASCDTAAVAGDHGDHLRAIFVDAAVAPPANGWMPAAVPRVDGLHPERRTARSLDLDVVPRAHAPPRRGWVTRGPPALS